MPATDPDPDLDWDTAGYVLSSDYRVDVLRRLSTKPGTPSLISSDTGNRISHVSRALRELRDKDLVQLLVSEDQKKGRVYALTDQGEALWHGMTAEGLVDEDTATAPMSSADD